MKPVFIPIPDVSKVRDIDLINILQDNGYFGAINPLPYLITPELINVPIYYNNSGDSVNALQTMLKYLGYFPKEQTITGLYGNITKEAVYQFQLSNMNLSWYEKYILKGKTVGPRTLLAINNIIL